MILRAVPVVLLLASLSTYADGQSFGKLAGRVTIDGSDNPLPGASIVIEGTGFGAISSANGTYVILGVPAGSHTVRASYVGFETAVFRAVVINAGYTRELDFSLEVGVSHLEEAVVKYERPIIQRDALGVPRVVTGEEIQNLPLRGVGEVAAMQAGVVAGVGREELHVRGGREQETVYFVDGVKVIGYSAVPQQAILEQEMLIGSLPAKYGDAMSGVVSITTRSGNREDLFGSIEAISSKLLDGYGYSLASVSMGGPVIGGKLSYFLAAEASHLDDGNPRAIPIPSLLDERRKFILNNPQSLRFRDAAGNAVYLPFPAHLPPTIDSDGDGTPDAVTMADVLNAVQAPERLTLDSPAPVDAAEVEPLESYVFRKKTPNADLDVIRSSGNLTFQPSGAVRLRAGYRYEDHGQSLFDLRQVLFNADRTPRVDRQTIGIWAAATHRLSGSSFYQVQVDWSQYRETTYDPRFSDDVSDVLFYGDIDNPANAVSRLYRIWDGNDSLYVPRSEDGRLADFRGVYDTFHEPGYASLDFSKHKDRQFRVTANATTQIGLHQVEFGTEFERRVERYFSSGGAELARYFDDGSVESGEGVSAYDELPFSAIGRRATYWGYDYLGLNEANHQDVERFVEGVQRTCNDLDAGASSACDVAPYQPLYYAGYVQDKFEYKDLVVNAGFRIDVFDNNTFVLKDRYALIPIVRAGTVPDRPANIEDDFAVYFDFADEVVGYRDLEGNFFDRFGQKAEGTDINLIGAPKVPDSEGAHISPAVFEDYQPRVSWLPRIGLSFSVTDRALFFAHFDKTSQRPFELPFEGLQSYWLTSLRSGQLASNNLLPETTLEYELGLRHRLGARAAISVSGFYKKIDRLIRHERLGFAFPNGYVTWGNDDFGTIKGLEIEFDLRRTKRFALTANYTLQYARGTGSDARWSAGRFIAQLRFDRRHTFTANVDYRLGRGEGPSVAGFRAFENFGLNVLLDLQSGRYFSRHESFRGRMIGPPNGQVGPWTNLVNIRLDRKIELGNELSLTPFLWIENLFDVDNAILVYTFTGRPDEDGFRSSGQGSDFLARQEIPETAYTLYGYGINNPSNYRIPRIIRLGMRVNF